MAKLGSSDLRRYAVLGAEQRLANMAEETEQIYRAFPELRAHGGRSGLRSRSAATSPGEESPRQRRKGRRRRKMSADARKRISDAQKARWAKQKGETVAGSAPAARKKK